MDLNVLLVDYFLNTSALWRMRWRYRLVVQVRGVLSGWDGVNLVRVVLGGWVEMNVDDDVEERSDRCLRKSGHRAVVVRGTIVFRGIVIVEWTTVIIVGGSFGWIISTTTLREDGRVMERQSIGTTKKLNPQIAIVLKKTQLTLVQLKATWDHPPTPPASTSP